jgi:glycerol kinase
MSKYVLALDQGTTSSRAILVDHAGNIASSGQQEYRQIFPDIGWVEHDPADILASQWASIDQALRHVRSRGSDIAAIGIANQRETTLLWDRETGKPVYNAIVWQDRRTAEHCDRLRRSGLEEIIRAKTGLVIDPYFSGTKLAWLLDNVDGVRSRADQGKLAFGTVDSWIVWNLTGGRQHVTDRTNASRTLLYNIVDDCWDADLLDILNIPESVLPDVVWSNDRVGRLSNVLGLEGVEIAGIAGDQQAALFGQICVNEGECKNTYGTGCFLLRYAGDQFILSDQKLLTTIACGVDRKLHYAIEGSVFIGGAVVQWLRDKMHFVEKASDIQGVAATVESSNGVVFVPAFAGLGAPHWDPYASGAIIGLQRSTEIGHIARAALESIAFQVTDVLRAMSADGNTSVNVLRVDGGASANDLLMQFQADMLQIPVERPKNLETTALGAAYLAGLSVGFWDSLDDIKRTRTTERVFVPSMEPREAELKFSRWLDAVERSKNWNKNSESR